MSGAGLPQSFQLANGCLVGVRRTPIAALVFEKWNDPPAGKLGVVAPLVVIDQDKRVSDRDQPQDLRRRALQLLGPERRAGSGRVLGGMQRRRGRLRHFTQVNHFMGHSL